ncbi:MAG: HK97 family phage prohead protease [Candidatus Nanoarchaeia archaeon]|nr:HK97 family phage prohead protease [Candidatus Nanoarchaeia archaeon]
MKKIINSTTKEVADRTIEFILSDETVDDVGDVMVAEGCDFSRFEKNPQFLGFHDSYEFPYGKFLSWGIDSRKKQVWGKVYFPKVEELSTNPELAAEHAKKIDLLMNMYKMRMMNAVSIGFDTIEDEYKNVEGKNIHFIKKWKIYETSAVPLPMNENALQKAKNEAGEDKKETFNWLETECKAWSQAKENDMSLETKGAIPFHAYPLAEEGTAWDGPKEIASAEVDDLMKMCTFVEDKPKEDLIKSDFKLPHHMKDGYKTVWKGVAAAYGVLLGARGGVSIPEGDIEACKKHLEKHYKEFSKDIPEGKAAWELQWKEIELEDTMELSDEIVEKIAEKVISKMVDLKTVKAGARLSRETREGLDKVAKCHDTIKEAHRMAVKAHKEAEEALLDLIEKESRYVEENESDGGSTYKPNAEGNGYEEETTSKEKMVEFEIEK